MVRAVALLLAGILVLSLIPVAMAAENVNFGITVTPAADKITVVVADGNDEAFAELAQENKHFALTVECGFDKAYVTFGENVVESTLKTAAGTIQFAVAKSGEYQILPGDAPAAPDNGGGGTTGGNAGGSAGSGQSSGSSASGGSGDSGSSSTTSSSYTAAAATTVPVQGDGSTVRVHVSVSGSSATLINVTSNQVKSVVGDKVKTGTVTVDLSGLNKNVDSVKIPANMLKQISEAAADADNDTDGLEVVLSKGISVEFNADSLEGIATAAKNSPVTFSVKDYRTAGNVTAEQKKAVGSCSAYDIRATANGTEISQIGGKVTVRVPYTLKAGEKAEGLAVYYVDIAGNREYCETSYDSQKKQICWNTDHFSVYMIAYEEPVAAAEAAETEAVETVTETEAAEPETQAVTQNLEPAPEKTGRVFLWISVVCFLLALVLACVLIWMRKKW